MKTEFRIEAKSDPGRAHIERDAPASFGHVLADLMVQIHHDHERGWHDATIAPFAPLEISPAAKVLHYGQEIFEGHKAYRWSDDEVALFRPELNARRLNISARRMRLPEVPEELQLEAVELLVDLVREWVPEKPGTSLYLRPALIGTEPTLGVGPSHSHLYFVIASPVGPYFPRGFSSISILVEEDQIRAAPGGVGAAKTGGNYAAGLAAQQRAREAGYDQVLWLDSVNRLYIEELNAMNVFAVINGVLCTPPLSGTILSGITRRTVLEIAQDLKLQAVERPIAIDQLVDDIDSGEVSELFAVGTAAIITPIGTLGFGGKQQTIGDGQPGPLAKEIYSAITGIQFGTLPDRHGWMRIVKRSNKSSRTEFTTKVFSTCT
jgi:branched-chain amino acid aminotransferase